MHNAGRLAGGAASSMGEVFARYGHLLPPYPGPTVVPLVTVPSPPLLDPAVELHVRAAVVARAWAAVLQRRYKVPRRAPKDIRGSKHWLTWAEGTLALTEHSVAPVAWIAFSIDAVWRVHMHPTRVPPLAWLLSSTRVEERLRWYHDVRLRYEGGRACIPDSLRDLVRRYEILVGAIRAAVLPTEATVRALVAQYLPPDDYAQRVQTARNESHAIQRTIAAMMARGEVSLWL